MNTLIYDRLEKGIIFYITDAADREHLVGAASLSGGRDQSKAWFTQSKVIHRRPRMGLVEMK